MKFPGRPVPNNAILAALITLTAKVPIEALEKALAQRFRGGMLARNLALARAAAQMVPAGLWKPAFAPH